MTLSAPQLARQLADVLEAAAIPHAIGGALALGVWGFPRATNDVDVDAFVEADAIDGLLQALKNAGFEIDEPASRRSALERGDFKFYVSRMRVDVFIASIPFYDEVRRRIRRAVLEGRPAWFLAPEDLIVFKLLFFRSKDRLDVERLVEFLGDQLDRGLVGSALADLLGPSDERVAWWKEHASDVS